MGEVFRHIFLGLFDFNFSLAYPFEKMVLAANVPLFIDTEDSKQVLHLYFIINGGQELSSADDSVSLPKGQSPFRAGFPKDCEEGAFVDLETESAAASGYILLQ